MFGPFPRMMGLLMAPRSSTSSSLSTGRPLASHRATPSAREFMMLPMTMFTTSFILAPPPIAPKKKSALPIADRSSLILLYNSSSPPQRKIKTPPSACALLPETGASRNFPPFSVTKVDISDMCSAVRVAQSTIHFPSETPEITPSSPKNTARSASRVDSMQYVRVQLSTTSLGVLATVAPNSAAKLSAFVVSLFQTIRVLPALVRFKAIPRPMIPIPTNPTGPSIAMLITK
mmetsp:Transcript_17805/g.25975  ORF Transcript_17805/g.25975 Transcript_17805/m.25975 type:complete len:232 (-) Transcript_17805:72-767(-)